MRVSLTAKAFLVCSLGLLSLGTARGAEGTEALLPCGLGCVGSCPGDVESYCAGVRPECAGPFFCNDTNNCPPSLPQCGTDQGCPTGYYYLSCGDDEI